MRRIVIWLASTVTVVVLLFGYHTSTNSPAASSETPSSSAPSDPATTPSSSASSRPKASGTPTASGSPTPSTSTAPSSSGTKTYTGDVAQTRWGPVELKLTVTGGKITKVSVLQQPDGNGRDQEINARALPILIQETLDAQSAKIDVVSGATVTSDGYLQSLQSALDAAGI